MNYNINYPFTVILTVVDIYKGIIILTFEYMIWPKTVMETKHGN